MLCKVHPDEFDVVPCSVCYKGICKACAKTLPALICTQCAEEKEKQSENKTDIKTEMSQDSIIDNATTMDNSKIADKERRDNTVDNSNPKSSWLDKLNNTENVIDGIIGGIGLIKDVILGAMGSIKDGIIGGIIGFISEHIIITISLVCLVLGILFFGHELASLLSLFIAAIISFLGPVVIGVIIAVIVVIFLIFGFFSS